MPRSTGASPALVSLCFFLSGFAGLALETVWSRVFALHVGGSAEGVTAVVTAYMAGLGLGSLLIAGRTRGIARPLRLYALLELGVAAFALASPFILRAPEGLYRIAHDFEEVSRVLPFAVRFITSLVLLLIPTVAMGATLPLLVESLARRNDRYASSVAWLYGINTMGAVLGTAVTGFVLLPRYGNHLSIVVAAAVDVGVALLLWTLTDAPVRAPDAAPRRARDADAVPPPLRRAVLAGFALSGALAMTYELGWTRRLATLIGSSVYSFTLLLATFLVGLGLGSLIAGPLVQRARRPVAWLGVAFGVTGVLALAGTALLNTMPDALRALLVRDSGAPTAILTGELGLAALVLLPAALLLGAIFPLAARAVRSEGDDAGHAIGQAYAVNTAGTVLGAAGAGLLLLPVLGTVRALQIAACLHVALGAALVLSSPWPRRRQVAVVGGLVALLAAVALLTPPLDLYRQNYGVVSLLRDLDRGAGPPPATRDLEKEELHPVRVLSFEEGRSATVAVVTAWESRMMVINGKVDASSADPTQVLLGQLPMILADSPRKALVIGFGSGITTHSVLTHPIERVETVEIEPAVVRAGRFFSDLNGRGSPDPRSVVFFEDGRTHLAFTRSAYDVIISEPSNPWIAGINNLFTREFYALVKQRLTPNGLFCQWLHVYEISRASATSLLATLQEAFPGAHVYRQNLDFLVIWSRNGATLTRARLDRAFADPAVRADLQAAGLVYPSDVHALYLGPLAEVVPPGGTLNTDDNGHVEFRAPFDLLRRGDTQPWRKPPLASLGLAAYNPSASQVDALRELWPGVARRRDVPRMVELADALAALAPGADVDTMRSAIARAEARLAATPQVAQLIVESDAQFAARDVRACEATLRAAVRLAPDDPDVLARYGRVMLALGNLPEAERALNFELLELTRQRALIPDATTGYQAHILLGMVAASQKRYDEALVHFDAAEALNPFQGGAFVLRSRTLDAMGRIDDARAVAEKGLAVDPHNRGLLAIARSYGMRR